MTTTAANYLAGAAAALDEAEELSLPTGVRLAQATLAQTYVMLAIEARLARLVELQETRDER